MKAKGEAGSGFRPALPLAFAVGTGQPLLYDKDERAFNTGLTRDGATGDARKRL
jgi:hypothetical protein